MMARTTVNEPTFTSHSRGFDFRNKFLGVFMREVRSYENSVQKVPCV